MKKNLFAIFIACFTQLGLGAQSLVKIRSIFLKADSVVLTGHAYRGMIVSKEEGPDDRKLVLNGNINPKFIKEQKRITDPDVKYLASFVTKPFKDKMIEESCFNPHHTIYIFKRKTVSYIDICFGCQEILCSADIQFPDKDFDRATWKKLEKFFRTQGFKYGFDENKPE